MNGIRRYYKSKVFPHVLAHNGVDTLRTRARLGLIAE